jgi:hypothetical protein
MMALSASGAMSSRSTAAVARRNQYRWLVSSEWYPRENLEPATNLQAAQGPGTKAHKMAGLRTYRILYAQTDALRLRDN